MTNQKHNHGAAVGGVESEAAMAATVKKAGFKLLKVKSDFEAAGLDPLGRRYFEKPSWYPQTLRETKKKKVSFYESDGFIQGPKFDIIVEQKNSNKHGTTEEKVFYDLQKIRDGVYGTEHRLWYVFSGDVYDDVGVYKLFEMIAKKENLPVTVIWGLDGLERALKELKSE